MSKVLDRQVIKEGNKVKVTESLENSYTKEELLGMKLNLQKQKQQVTSQMKQLRERYDYLVNQEKDIDNMIVLLPDESIEIPTV